MIKKKAKYNDTSRQLKKAGIKGGIAPHRKGEWERERENHKPPGKPKRREGKKPLELSTAVKMEMARDRASGMTEPELAAKYSISTSYVHAALQKLHLTSAKAREILKNVLYTNAVACGMQARAQMGNLSPMQSVIATGIFTQRAIDMDKHTAGQSADVDFSQLTEVGELLRDLRGNVALPSDKEGDIIDIGESEGE